MAIEADLEAFRGLVLERQIVIQSRNRELIKTNKQVYDDFDPLLGEIIGDSHVFVTGSVFSAEQIDDGFIIDPATATTSAFGESKGLLVADRSIILPSGVTSDALIIGFLVELVGNDRTTDYAFAPAERSYLSAIDLEVYSDTVLPEADDELAESLETCLLDENINFTTLGTILDKIGDNQLVADYYLGYINHIFDLKAFTFDFTSDCLIHMTKNPDYTNALQSGTVCKVSCDPEKFVFSREAGGLCIAFNSKEGYGQFLVPIHSLKAAHFEQKE